MQQTALATEIAEVFLSLKDNVQASHHQRFFKTGNSAES